jgi:glycogen debranching enzyme
MPLIAVSVIEGHKIRSLPGFQKRLLWFLQYKPGLRHHVVRRKSTRHDGDDAMLLAIPSEDQLRRMLKYILDEDEFLSEYGLRSLSKYHEKHPYIFHQGTPDEKCVTYNPGESTTNMFGGNSNWRGPIWLCINYLVIEALERYHHAYGDDWKVECPTRSGKMMNLLEVSQELARRLVKIFRQDENGKRPLNGNETLYATDPYFRDLVLFYEYFHGDTGRGVGANHQTGWTALIIRHIEDIARARPN